jgi:poly-beta-1,6-N-acetyl-D-glucosamine biosynthesis protein PgaD
MNDIVFDIRNIIIDRPELQSKSKRALFGVLTAGLWSFYLYLLLPLASLLAWWLGFVVVYEEMVMLRGWEKLLGLLGVYGAIVLAMGLAQVGWALTNWLRFYGRRDRRRERPPVMSAEFAEPMFLTDTGEFPVWMNAKRLVVHHHPTQPRITSVEID